MKHKTRENIIIYGCLILAVILIGYVLKEYYENKNNSEVVLKELQEVFGSSSTPEVEVEEIVEEEPDEYVGVDKINVINNYFDDILNRRIEDKLLTYKVVSSWGDFSIESISYKREITSTYHAYDVSIKINNKDAKITGKINEELSTNEYTIVVIEFDISYKDGVSIKNVSI